MDITAQASALLIELTKPASVLFQASGDVWHAPNVGEYYARVRVVVPEGGLSTRQLRWETWIEWFGSINHDTEEEGEAYRVEIANMIATRCAYIWRTRTPQGFPTADPVSSVSSVLGNSIHSEFRWEEIPSA